MKEKRLYRREGIINCHGGMIIGEPNKNGTHGYNSSFNSRHLIPNICMWLRFKGLGSSNKIFEDIFDCLPNEGEIKDISINFNRPRANNRFIPTNYSLKQCDHDGEISKFISNTFINYQENAKGEIKEFSNKDIVGGCGRKEGYEHLKIKLPLGMKFFEDSFKPIDSYIQKDTPATS
mgnify:CR=1 FL=1